MAVKTVADFISDNFCVYRTMTIKGFISLSKVNEYKIYCYFKGLPDDMPKMEKYSNTAIEFGVSEIKVMRAIKSMDQKI